MRTYILASHGKLSEGILDSAEMIIGKQKNVKVFSLIPGEHPKYIGDKVREMILKSPETEFIIATDIMGGSVHMELSKLLKYKQVYLISGMNLAMILELFLADENEKIPVIIENILSKAKDSIIFANDLFKQNYKDGGDEEWLNC